MELCCICHRMIRIGDTGTLTIGNNDIGKEICAECEKQINVLTNSDNPGEIKHAINYLYSYKVRSSNEEVASYLNDILVANSSVLDELDTVQENNRPISTGAERDYFKDKEESESEDLSSQYSICHKPDKIAVSLFDAARTTTFLGIIVTIFYLIFGIIVDVVSSQIFIVFLGHLIISFLIFVAFKLLAIILKGFAAVVQNTRDTVRLQKQQADEIAELIKKYNK